MNYWYVALALALLVLAWWLYPRREPSQEFKVEPSFEPAPKKYVTSPLIEAMSKGAAAATVPVGAHETPKEFAKAVIEGISKGNPEIDVSLIEVVAHTPGAEQEFILTVYERVSNITRDVRVRVGSSIRVSGAEEVDDNIVQPSVGAGGEERLAEFISPL